MSGIFAETVRTEFSIRLTAKRPGEAKFSSDEVEIAIYKIPIRATDDEIIAMADRALRAEDLLRQRFREKLGEAPRIARRVAMGETYEPTMEEYLADVEGEEPEAAQPIAGVHVFRTCYCDGEGTCAVCGGLSMCIVCNGAEGSLPTDCPDERMSSEIEDDVYRERLDFRGGQWVSLVANPIPHADEISTNLSAFGIEARIPSAEDYALPITTGEDGAGGQMKALNTVISVWKLQRVRHDAAATVLAELGLNSEFSDGSRRTFSALDKARAGVLLDWFGNANDEAISLLKATIAEAQNQGRLI